jgi:hypothetical protein
MLNELCQLADSLEKADIAPKDWFGQLKLLPQISDKKPCYRIFLTNEGRISSIDKINAELAPQLRKWEPSNGNSFPGFNIQPLFRLVKEDQKNKLKVWRDGKEPIDIDCLKSWLSEETNNWDNKLSAKLKKCLKEIPQALLTQIKAKDTISSGDSLIKLLSRVVLISQEDFGSSANSQNNFRSVLEDYLWAALIKSESVKTCLGMLIYEGVIGKTPEEDRGAISVFLDIPDWIDYPVSSVACIEALNSLLVSGSQQELVVMEIDAFGGSTMGSEDKLPGVKLPFVAEVKLRAMNSESTCQFRYGTIDAESFPIGLESRKRAKGALEWLGDQSREGETWGRADSKELIFAYPAVLPKVSLKLAACFGAQKAENSEPRFANAAKDVIAGLTGITQDLRSLDLRVFSLKKMDKARTKVVFQRNYSAQRIVDAAKDWEEGAENTPPINIRAWGEKKGDVISLQTEIPFPLQIAPCLNRVWKLNGTTECEAPVITPSQGIELLLDENPERFIPHLLSVVLQNGKGLLLSMGNDLNQGKMISTSKGYDKHKLLIPSILGLLLHKLGIRKEFYMSNAPFLVGRMLKLADELHALYCKEVRENKLPPQLIGNTLMTAALESPTQSLAQLAMRLKPYYGWAQTFRGKENGGLAGYYIGLYGDVSKELSCLELPSRFNDAERAQFLLGYLSANPKKADKITETIPTERI